MKIERVRIRRVMRGENGAAWAAALADPAWLAGSTVLKDEPGSSWVRRARINEWDVVVKCRLLNRPSRWIKAALRYGHADKHWRGATLLHASDIPTGAPIILGHGRVDGCVSELLVLRYVRGKTVLAVMEAICRLAASRVRFQDLLARMVALRVFEMSRCGLQNRDHKPSNLILTKNASGDLDVAVIDCVGVRRGRMDSDRLLISLVLEPLGCGVLPRRSLLFRFLLTYTQLHGVLNFNGLPTPAMVRQGVHSHWRRLADQVQRHADPRPKINPLSPPPTPVGP